MHLVLTCYLYLCSKTCDFRGQWKKATCLTGWAPHLGQQADGRLQCRAVRDRSPGAAACPAASGGPPGRRSARSSPPPAVCPPAPAPEYAAPPCDPPAVIADASPHISCHCCAHDCIYIALKLFLSGSDVAQLSRSQISQEDSDFSATCCHRHVAYWHISSTVVTPITVTT